MPEPLEIAQVSGEAQLERGVFGRGWELIIILAEEFWRFGGTKIPNVEAAASSVWIRDRLSGLDQPTKLVSLLRW